MRHKRSQGPYKQSGISWLIVLWDLVLIGLAIGGPMLTAYYGAKRAQEEKPEPLPANVVDYNNAVLTDWGDFRQ